MNEINWSAMGLVLSISSAAIGTIWTMLNEKIKNIKTEADKAAKALDEEIKHQRSVSAKIFDVLSDIRQDIASKHVSVIEKLYEGLDKKASK